MLIAKPVCNCQPPSTRKVAGSESDLLESLSRQASPTFQERRQSEIQRNPIPPILKAHSDGVLVTQMESPSGNIRHRGIESRYVNDLQNMTKRENNDQPVYSIPDLTISNPTRKKSLPNNHYYSPTTPEPHEAFRVCLLSLF